MKVEKKAPFFKFYFVSTTAMVLGSFARCFRGMFFYAMGWWRCEGCGRHYSPRVKQYDTIERKKRSFLGDCYNITISQCSNCFHKLNK